MMTLLAALYLTLPPSPDQSQFDWMAFIATQGQPYYAGSFDMNWPGAMWLHEAGIRLFGIHGWTWRLTDFLLMSGFAAAGAIFLARSGWRLAPFVFLFLYPPLYITAGGWMAGERDIIATGFLLAACAFAMPGSRREGLAVLLAGLCVAAAVLIRPTFLSFIVGLIVVEALPFRTQKPRRLSRPVRAAGFAVGLIAGMGTAVAAGLFLGNLEDWYQQSIEFSLSIYVGEPPQDWRLTLYTLFVRSWHWITLLALPGFLFWALRDRFGHGLVLLLGIGATSAVSFAVQNKGFGYHLGGILPVLVLLIAVAFDRLSHLCREAPSRVWRVTAFSVLTLSSLLVLAGTASKMMSFQDGARLLLSRDVGPVSGYGLTETERRKIIELIREGSSPNDTVIVYGTNFELAYRAERLPTYRFINAVIDQTTPDFRYYAAWMAEIETALAQQPPAYLIFHRGVISGSINDPVAKIQNRPVLAKLLALVDTGYAPVFSNNNLVVYEKAR